MLPHIMRGLHLLERKEWQKQCALGAEPNECVR